MRYTTHAHSEASEANGLAPNNGFATNGKSSSSSSLALVQPAWSTLYKDSVHDREQAVRTILQALRDVGYTEAAATLERESGYQLESEDVAQLRHAVTHGLWDEAPSFLRRLGVIGDHERRSSCTHHAGSQADKAFSLYVNHSCSRTQFPTLTTHILAEHLDEVWRLEWSHDGRFLASASQDKTAIIWKISDLQPGADPTTRECLAERVLSGHEYAVNALAWSPDDKILLTSAEHVIKMWDVSSSTGEKLYELGAVDEKPLPIRVTDLTITSDGSRLVAVGTLVVPPPTSNNFDPSRQTRSMKVFSLSSKSELFHAPDEVQLWDLDAQRMCQKYTGHYQGKHVIRSCLGGPSEGFVLSGSEDQTLYIWKRDTGVLIEVLSGHGNGCVNDVAWNPRDPALFASCSDDHTIRLWSPPPSNLVVNDLQDRHNILPPRAAI
ncbi:putative WD repeat-containing protein C343,04c [Rhizoctonia solani AG-1 IB]|uniref:Putative WD repeat-containing protein C343,04c n=1 Tax=Thanatephorus cucumeris (strain AG1-IB / isolate 7/3/14) TaxID=1108050 RepID=M5BLM1_THACB|nr:putative WD repeat-containing protein C343,04c [Rhizoctonia solani AG-1 IB]